MSTRERPSVFDPIARDDSSLATASESTFAFLNRVDSLFFDRVRNLIERWWERLCPESKDDVRSRLRSRDNRQFRGAFWELYIHESLLRLGCDVVCHPEVQGEARRPDFLARWTGGEFFVEATLAADSDVETAATRRQSQIEDTLNRLDSPDFFIWLEIMAESDRSPSVKRMRLQLAKWLDSLEPDRVAAEARAAGYAHDALPEYVWNEDGWEIRFQAIPKKPEARGKPGRAVGASGPGEAYIIDDKRALRRAIMTKASAYGTIHRPYIVAVMAESFTLDDYDVTGALFGSEQVVFTQDHDGETSTRMQRARDGVWIGAQGPQNTQVSAVLLARNLNPWSVAGSEETSVTLWHHPAAEHPVPLAELPWRAAAVDRQSGRLEYYAPTMSLADLFDLPEDWPGPEAPFPDGAC